MRFDVEFDPYHNKIFIAQQKLHFFGKGVVFLHDTALICQGNSPKFDIWWFNELLGKPLFALTARTVPYSTILIYRPATKFRKKHEIIYQLPDNKKCLLQFEMTNKINNQVFANKMDEYRNVNKFI
jgi:hypothetical protein